MPASSNGKVRIIGGKWKRSSVLVLDAKGLRPTGNRQRETLFNWLSHLLGSFSEKRALDMFGGSGVLSLEFLSREGKSATLFDTNRNACAQIRSTAQKIGADNLEVYCADSLSNHYSRDDKFDVIFIDPPFSLNLQEQALNKAVKLLSADGLIYVESPEEISNQMLNKYALHAVRRLKAGTSNMLLAELNEE